MVLNDLYYFHIPTKLVIGCGAVSQLVTEARALCINHPLIVTDSGMKKSGIMDKILGQLSNQGLSCSIFDGVVPNPKISTIEAGVAVYQKQQCDGLISVGGGSPIDAAKGIGVLAKNSGSLMEFEGSGKVKTPIPPHIAIPTTYGTGSEVSFAAMITDPARNLKTAIGSPLLFPKVAIIDPELALGLPRPIAASTGMDALTHAIESYVSLKAQPITEAISLYAIRLVSENLRKAVTGDKEGTANMMIAASMGGMSISHTRTGAVHAMAHILGGHFDVPHGITNAILLPHVMEFNLETCPEKYREISKAMGERVEGLSLKEAAEKSVEVVEQLNKDLGLPIRLREIGCDDRKFSKIAEDTMNTPVILVNPRKATKEDILKLLRKAF